MVMFEKSSKKVVLFCVLTLVLFGCRCNINAIQYSSEETSTIETPMLYIVDTLQIKRPCHVFIPYASCNIMFVVDSNNYAQISKQSIEELIESPIAFIELVVDCLYSRKQNIPNSLRAMIPYTCVCGYDPYFHLDSIERLIYDNRKSQYYLLMFMRADCLHACLHNCIGEYNEQISLKERIYRKRHFVHRQTPYRYYRVVVPLCDDAIIRMKQQNTKIDEWLWSLYPEYR